ncbi:MAG: putative rane protein [Mycobacterium sp.]|nr:putative rane protein [Mycobacterium sp.]
MNVFSADGPAAVRLAGALLAGGIAAVCVGLTAGWPYVPAAGWIVAASIYLAWTWTLVGRMDPTRTGAHARHVHEEDSTRGFTQVVVLLASVASLGGVGYLLAAESTKGGDLPAAAVGILSVAASWFAVHTVFMLRYARLYYTGPPEAIDFNQDEAPAYADFAYLAFTLGMTYQVSDTNLRSRTIRSTALTHALLSFLLGAVILAMTLNLVVGLTTLN